MHVSHKTLSTSLSSFFWTLSSNVVDSLEAVEIGEEFNHEAEKHMATAVVCFIILAVLACGGRASSEAADVVLLENEIFPSPKQVVLPADKNSGAYRLIISRCKFQRSPFLEV